MSVFWPIAHVVLAGSMAGLGMLLWGALRSLGRLAWHLEQWETTTPRVRRGPTVGSRAPRFALLTDGGGRARLSEFSGRRVLLVFADDPGELQPELERLHRRGGLQVLLVRNQCVAAQPAGGDEPAGFPVLRQREGRLARRYRIVEAPFAVVIDERGIVAASAVVRRAVHLGFLLESAQGRQRGGAQVARTTSPEIEAARPRLRGFVPRPDDIFVVTYPRSGTTWTQMILYQLTTDGGMEFLHIDQACPWFERALRAGRDLDALPGPRVFKSHLTYRRIPKGPCRYVYVARDGKDVAVSYYHFARSHMGFRGSFDEFFERFLAGRDSYGSWLRHVAGWWAHRDDPNVLLLRYEDLVRDLAGGLRTLIDFLGLDVPPERLSLILERCSFAFMKAHETRFDPLIGMLYERHSRPDAHLRRGRIGGWEGHLSPEQRARYDKVFDRRLQRLGLDFSAEAAPRECPPAAPITPFLDPGRLVPCPEIS
jgi:hypothetical protein